MKMKNIMKGLSVFLTVLMVCMLIPINASAATIKLNHSSVSVAKGSSFTLKVSGSTKTPKWSTTNKKVATVTSKGKVTAVGAGTCYIKATVGTKTLKCKVKVINPSLSVSTANVELEEGDSELISVTAKGSKGLKISHSDKTVSSCSWVLPWEGNDIGLNINAKKAGTDKIKIYMTKYTSVYKTVTVTVTSTDQEIDSSDDNTEKKTSKILADKSVVSLDKGSTTTLTVYSDNTDKTTITSSDTSVVTVSTPKWNTNGYASVTLTGVKGGNAKITVSASDNANIKKEISVTVLSDGYYDITTTSPVRRLSTDVILQWTENNVTKYMLAPMGYDSAHTNSLFVKDSGKSQYYKVFEESPVKLNSTDTISSFKVTISGQSVARFVLLPASYDSAKYNTEVAGYTGSYEYYTIYNVNPIVKTSTDVVKSWQASVDNVTYTRYVLLPAGYTETELDAIMKSDKEANSIYYSVSTTIPTKQTETDEIYTFYANGKTAYILLPKGYDSAKRDTSAAKYSGSYNYYTIYTEKPETRMSTDTIKSWNKIVDGKSTTRYMLLPAGYSEEVYNSLKKSDMNTDDMYYVVSSEYPTALQSGDKIYSWYNSKLKATRYMLLPEKCDVLKRNNAVYADTGVFEYYKVYSVVPTVKADGDTVQSVYTESSGTIYILVPANYDNAKLQAAIDEVNQNT